MFKKLSALGRLAFSLLYTSADINSAGRTKAETFSNLLHEEFTMPIINTLLRDENGFVVSAELVIVATIAVLSMAVGLSEISFSVNNELEDVGSAVGTMNQSFYANGIQSVGKSGTSGSGFVDRADDCDGQFDVIPAGVRDEDYRAGEDYRY